jgi:hypothetical protein
MRFETFVGATRRKPLLKLNFVTISTIKYWQNSFSLIMSGAPAPMIITTLCILLFILDGKEEKVQTVLTGPDGHPDYLATASHKTFQQPNDLDSFQSLVRFFAKRIPCNCLNETKQDFHKTCSKLRFCVACRKAAKYCSKECQHADWPSRKEFCSEIGAIGRKKDGK